eukprot:9489852-Pyramimonas_sp.AAC.1
MALLQAALKPFWKGFCVADVACIAGAFLALQQRAEFRAPLSLPRERREKRQKWAGWRAEALAGGAKRARACTEVAGGRRQDILRNGDGGCT